MSSRLKWAIPVLGMHRSGTSVLTNVLSLLGARLPQRLMAAHDSNPMGHFEPEVIVFLHDQVLAAAGSSWSDWRKLPDNWFLLPECAVLKQQLVAAYLEDFGDSLISVIKDPRLCRLVPLWEGILDEVNRHRWYVLQFRHPIEVVNSLARRNGIEPYHGYMIWLRHLLDAELSTRHQPRAFLRYESLLTNSRSTLEKMVALSPVPWGRGLDQAMPEINLALMPQLRHNRAGDEELSDRGKVPESVHEVFECYQRLEQDPTDRMAQSGLDTVRKRVEIATELAKVTATAKVMPGQDSSQYPIDEDRLQLLRLRLQELLASYPSELAISPRSQSAGPSELGELRRQLDHRSARIGYLYAVLADHIAALVDLRGKTAKLQDELLRSGSTEAALRSQLADQRLEAGEVEKRWKELQASLSATLAELAELTEKHSELKASYSATLAELAQLKASEMESQASMAKSLEESQQLQTSLSERDAQLAQATDEITQFQTKLSASLAYINSLQASYERSTSWRVTAPLRWIKAQIIQRSKVSS